MTGHLAPIPLTEDHEKPVIRTLNDQHLLRFRSVRIIWRLTRMFARIVLLKLTGRYSHQKAGEYFVEMCQKSGVLWVKIGQFLSARVDILPLEICQQLTLLQDSIHGFGSEGALAVVEEDLGEAASLFSRFDSEPLAAASIAQVHRARLAKEDVEVVVKVRRPQVRQIFRSDFKLVRFLCAIPEKLGIRPELRWSDLLWELEVIISEELDYRYESANLMRMRRRLIAHGVRSPRLYPAYCSSRIIVMDFIDGVTMAELLRVEAQDPERVQRWMKANGIDRAVLGKKIFSNYLRQVLEDNLFHGDLHPGNIMILKNNHFALIDFGSIGSIEGDCLRKYNAHLEAVSEGQFAKAIDLFLLIMYAPAQNLASMKEELLRELHAWGLRSQIPELPFKEKSTGLLSNYMIRISAKYGVTIPWSLLRVIRGFTALDISLNSLTPRVDLPGLMRSYTQQRRRRELQGMINMLPFDALKLQRLIDYPAETGEMAIYRGAMVRRLAQVFEGATDRVSSLAATAFSFFAVGGFVVFIWMAMNALTKVFQWRPPPAIESILLAEGAIDIQVWFIGMVITGFGVHQFAFLARRFLKEE